MALRRAWMLAEKLMLCKEYVLGGPCQVAAFQSESLSRMERRDFGDGERRAVVGCAIDLTSSVTTRAWVDEYIFYLKQELAGIIGCRPENIRATPVGVWQLDA